jgi:hypothetical protein
MTLLFFGCVLVSIENKGKQLIIPDPCECMTSLRLAFNQNNPITAAGASLTVISHFYILY